MGDGAKTRRRILDVTWRLLSKDPAGTRMEDVAKAVGISRQALYLHFPDRASLLVATAAHGDELLGLEEATRPVREAPTAVETLDRLAEFWGDYLGKVYDVALALEALRASDAAVDAAIRDREHNRMRGGIAIAARIEEEGVLAPDLSRADAAVLIVAIGSYHLWAELTRQRGWSKRRYVAHVQRLLHRTLLEPSSRDTRPGSTNVKR